MFVYYGHKRSVYRGALLPLLKKTINHYSEHIQQCLREHISGNATYSFLNQQMMQQLARMPATPTLFSQDGLCSVMIRLSVPTAMEELRRRPTYFLLRCKNVPEIIPLSFMRRMGHFKGIHTWMII